jgi:acetyl esterase/lipase
MECGVQESSLAELLLQRGFSLMGLRVYKALLLLRVLASSAAIDPARIGLLGHSGGSSASWLVVRISDQVRARVWDYEQFFNNLCGERIHCETHPDLFAIGGDIFRRATLPQPNLQVPYAYLASAVRDDIRAFFAQELQP